ncbi:hypothetical protein AWB72_03562 [Caballeronia concitans]|uniref:Uncharacterized protein n=2 Tax=Caballeronia concitans TaxID=1777133 RepID=A0A658QZU6_9BURK|nr:hypothetical protein BurMR1_2406 [Burkholderia sp. MR1]SAL36032.1 hypothetical protein AWB72_03562 [Caballeronia concitans]
MDQHDELRSLYSVICPRCQSISPADDIACPYCGADRHGATLTRADESAAVLRESSSSGHGAQMEGYEPDRRAPTMEASSPSFLALARVLSPRPNRAILLAVSVCFVAGAYALMHATLNNGARSQHTGVSAVGTVGLAAPISPADRTNERPATKTKEGSESSRFAPNRLLAFETSLQRVAFIVPGSAQMTPCSVTPAAALGLDMLWCDPRANKGVGKAIDSREERPMKADEAKRDRLMNARPSTNAQRTVRVEEKQRVTPSVGKSKPTVASKSNACSGKGDACKKKAASRGSLMDKKPQRTASREKKLEASYTQSPTVLPPVVNPAMTSAGSWTPSTSPEPYAAALHEDTSRTVPHPRATTSNKGRGEAH